MLQIDIQELLWDSFNERHMQEKHQITRADVEEICFSEPPTFFVEDGHDGRFRVIGPRNDGKILVVILAPEDTEKGIYYPVTAKQTKRQELRRYMAWKAGTEHE